MWCGIFQAKCKLETACLQNCKTAGYPWICEWQHNRIVSLILPLSRLLMLPFTLSEVFAVKLGSSLSTIHSTCDEPRIEKYMFHHDYEQSPHSGVTSLYWCPLYEYAWDDLVNFWEIIQNSEYLFKACSWNYALEHVFPAITKGYFWKWMSTIPDRTMLDAGEWQRWVDWVGMMCTSTTRIHFVPFSTQNSCHQLTKSVSASVAATGPALNVYNFTLSLDLLQ